MPDADTPRMNEVWSSYRGWLRDERDYAPTTRYRYVLYSQAAHRWFQAQQHAGLLWATADDVKRYYFSLSKNAGTRNDQRAGLIVFFDFTLAQGWRKDKTNPAADLPRYKVPKRLPHPLQDETTVKLLDMAEHFGPMANALMHLFIYTGIRHAECRNLRWTDLDGDWLRIVGKGNKERAVPIPEVCLETLRTWRRECPSVEYVFPSPRYEDRPISASTLASLVSDIGDCAGIPGLHPHKLRHTYATALLDTCGDLAVVQQALGHASPATTTIYAKVNPEKLRSAGKSLNYG